MSYFTHKEDARKETNGNGYILLSKDNGCTNGCVAGYTAYPFTEYQKPGCHQDQEGFIVLSGNGWAKLGDEERMIKPGTAFIAPKDVPHVIKSADPADPVVVFWFHAAV